MGLERGERGREGAPPGVETWLVEGWWERERERESKKETNERVVRA